MNTHTVVQQFELFIEGKMTSASEGQYFNAINPSYGEVFARIADADSTDIKRAVSAARLAFDHGRWPQLGLVERGGFLLEIARLIRENAKELADLESWSTGKTIKHTTFIDVPTAAESFEYFGKLSGDIARETITNTASLGSLLVREPVGVVAAIIPWNYPLIMTAWKLAPALLAGNTIVLKTSPVACASIMRLAQLISSIGLPKGVLNIISASSPKAGQDLITLPEVDMISFTGSTKTGEAVMAEAAVGVRKLTLELGGKSPNIVFADCDIEAAIGGTLSAIFMNQGQMCTAGSRLLLDAKIYPEFMEKLIARAKQLHIGPADNFETEFGPLVSVAHRDAVLAMIKKALNEGAKLACGGQIPADNLKGAYLQPTILTGVRNNMSIAQEEIFGPVLSVMPFTSPEEALHIANDTKFGLAAMIWTKDLAKANKLARQLRCGTVWVNTYGAFLNEAPFGGYKQSGFGRELGMAGLYEYMQIKHIAIDETPSGKPLVSSWF